MSTADFAAHLRAGGVGAPARRGLWVSFLTPFGLEVAGVGGADWMGLDLQHGDLEVADVAPLLRVSPVPVLARVASHDPGHLGRVLDAGVDGVIVPAVESAADVAALVAACCLPPTGARSTGLSRAALVGRSAPLLLAMVETRAGLENVEEIASAPGLDGIFVGPYDLALSLGQPSVLATTVLTAVERIVSAAHRQNRLAGAFAGNTELAARLPSMELVGVDSDVAALRAGLRALLGSEADARAVS